MLFFDRAVRYSIAIFFVTIISVLALKYPFDAFSTGYDPYYHAVHGQTYFTDVTLEYPILTYFSEYPGDPWFGYHWLIGAAHKTFNHFGTVTLIESSIYVHALFSGILFVVLFWFLRTVFLYFRPFFERDLVRRSITGKIPDLDTSRLALFTIVLLALSDSNFIFRAAIIERPHIIMITIVLATSVALMKRKLGILFVLALITPLVYSLALFIYIPLVGLVFGWLLVDRSMSGVRTMLAPFGAVTLGLVIGAALHPDSVGYLVNGVGFHTFAIVHGFIWWLPGLDLITDIPSEMSAVKHFPSLIFVFILTGLFALCFERYTQIMKETAPKRIGQDRYIETGFILLAMCLAVGSLFVNRLVEYAAPFTYGLFVIYILYFLYPMVRHHYLLLSREDPEMHQTIQTFLNRLYSVFKTIYFRILICVFAVILVSTSVLAYIQLTEKFNVTSDRYAGTAAFLSEKMSEDDVLLNVQFSYYAQLISHEPSLRIASGMDNRMVFAFDPALARDINKFVAYSAECQIRSNCTNDDPDTKPGFITERNISHVMIDEELLNEKQAAYIQSYTFLNLVYTDEEYPEVKIYSIENSP